MRWSFKIARIAGIEIRIHVTFFLLLALVGSYGAQAGSGGALNALILWLLVFLCVLLHEFGHAFAAKAYGIKTADITLLPIGGVARMDRLPEKPLQELVVAIAGGQLGDRMLSEPLETRHLLSSLTGDQCRDALFQPDSSLPIGWRPGA